MYAFLCVLNKHRLCFYLFSRFHVNKGLVGKYIKLFKNVNILLNIYVSILLPYKRTFNIFYNVIYSWDGKAGFPAAINPISV